MASFQIIQANEDGYTRLPERYATYDEAKAEADRRYKASSRSVQSWGGEWFQCDYFRVVEAR